MPDFAYLKTDLVNTTENDSTEFSTQVSAFVKKTEFRLVKDLDDVGLNEYNSVSVSGGNAGAIPLNDRALVVRNVNFVVSNGTSVTNLLQRTTEYVNDYMKKNMMGGGSLSPKQKDIAQMSGNPNEIEATDFTALRNKKYGGKINYRMGGGKVVDASYE